MRRRLMLWSLSALLIALQLQLWFGAGGVVATHRLQQRVDAELADNAAGLQRNEAIQADVDNLRKSGEAIQARARTELGMVRRGETFFLVVHPN